MRVKTQIATIKLTALFAGGLLCPALLSAQTTGGVSEEVTVVKEYEAVIQDAQKVTIAPNIPEIAEKPKVFDYTIPTKDYKEFTFETNPLKPIALSPEKLEKYNSSFIKLGFGTQLMPLAQLAYNDNKSKNVKFGIWYNHLSAAAYKNKLQRFSDDEASAYVRGYIKKVEIGTQLTFRNYRTHFYGTDSSEAAKNIRQVYRNYDALVYFKNTQKNKAEVDFNQTLRFNYTTELFGKAKEWYINGNTDFSKGIKKQHAILARFNFDVSNLSRDTTSLQRNIFTIAPGYSFNNDDWKAHAFIGLSLNNAKPFFYADLHLEKRLYQHALIAYIGYSHKYQKNSLYSLAQVNPFIQNSVAINNTLQGDFGIGLKGTLNTFSYNAAFHLNHNTFMPFYVNDSMDVKRFVVAYDSSTVIYNVHLEAGYNAKEWLRLLVLADFNQYKLKNLARPWHEPAFKLTLRANYIWKNKISVTFDLYGITPTYAQQTDGTQVKLKGTADINLGVEYIFSKHLSFFGMVNNLAHVRYQKWYRYPSYGINGMIGAKFSF